MTDELGTVVLFERPELREPALVVAFGGWPDAAEVATGALRYLTAKVGARRLGYIDTDSFYDFTTARPVVAIERGAIQNLRYPASDLFYWQNPAGERDLLILLAGEPQLRWRQYIQTLLQLAREYGVTLLISLGGLYDAVPHTAAPRLSALATSRQLRERLVDLGVTLSEYQGPSSIHSALQLACQKAGLDAISLWGHAPAYVRAVANPKVCHALLARLCPLLGVALNLGELQAAGEYLDKTLNRLLAQNEELRLYVRRLEEQVEGSRERAAEGEEDTERIIRDVEEFLRREQRRGEEGQ